MSDADAKTPANGMISLRWRLLIPLLALAGAAVVLAYVLTPANADSSAQTLLNSYRLELESRLALIADGETPSLAALQPGAAVELVRLIPDGVPETTLTPAPNPDQLNALYTLPTDGRAFLLNGVNTYAARVSLPDDSAIVLLLPADALPSPDVWRQINALTAALVAAVLIAAVVALVQSRVIKRADAVRAAAEALANGTPTARTNMQPQDEIGAIGQALDRYADYVQQRQDSLRVSLRRQRREIAHLTAVLEMLPDGVIVQDSDGRVVFTNERAKELLGSKRLEGGGVEELTSVVTDTLGPALAPGLYALGNPQRVEVNGRMLSAQVAAVTSFSNQRVGKVALLRDITDDVRRERAREALLKRMSDEVQRPLADSSQTRAVAEPAALAGFAREISRHAVALQKLIVEMRELSADIDTRALKRVQRPIQLETLVWALANEWRQVAQAANLKLQVQIERSGLYILGDERRLRWAIGNLLDNAIKYTPPGGAVSLEIKGEEGSMARLRIRDNGVGIAPEELPHVFDRFYRGSPVTSLGRAIRVPGTGQGLAVAKDIIESHGGQIMLKSDPAKGTAVYFTLPLTAPESLSMPTQTTPSARRLPDNAQIDDFDDEPSDETRLLRPSGL